MLTAGTTVTVRDEGDVRVLSIDDSDVGRIRDSRLELGELEASLERTGQRTALVASGATPVLRLDPAGRKATTLTTATGRFRLARQRPVPLLHRRVLTRGVTGESVLTVRTTPLGTRVDIDDVDGIHPQDVAALVLGALALELDVQPAHAAV